MGRIRALLRASGTVLVAIVAGALFSTAAEAAPGDLDTTFSTDGTQRTDFLTGESQAAAVVRQPDGKIVAVGLNTAQAPSISRSPATTRTARSTRASPRTAGR